MWRKSRGQTRAMEKEATRFLSPALSIGTSIARENATDRPENARPREREGRDPWNQISVRLALCWFSSGVYFPPGLVVSRRASSANEFAPRVVTTWRTFFIGYVVHVVVVVWLPGPRDAPQYFPPRELPPLLPP